MKKILIIAICFMPLINAADDTNEIERELGDLYHKRIFKGHALDKEEHHLASFVGIHQSPSFTIIRAEYREDEGCIFGTKGGYEEVTFNHSGSPSNYQCYNGYHYHSSHILNNDPQDIDSKSMQRALSLCAFYFKIHEKKSNTGGKKL